MSKSRTDGCDEAAVWCFTEKWVPNKTIKVPKVYKALKPLVEHQVASWNTERLEEFSLLHQRDAANMVGAGSLWPRPPPVSPTPSTCFAHALHLPRPRPPPASPTPSTCLAHALHLPRPLCHLAAARLIEPLLIHLWPTDQKYSWIRRLRLAPIASSLSMQELSTMRPIPTWLQGKAHVHQ